MEFGYFFSGPNLNQWRLCVKLSWMLGDDGRKEDRKIPVLGRIRTYDLCNTEFLKRENPTRVTEGRRLQSWLGLPFRPLPSNLFICKMGSRNGVSKVISELLWFCITSLSDWFKVLAPLFQPSGSETKTNRGSGVHIFPHFLSATCN